MNHLELATLVSARDCAKVGHKLYFDDEKQGYTIQARSGRYAICSKPFNPRKTVLYCVVDFDVMERGPENLVFGFGAETREQCEEMLERVESGETEISYRNKRKLFVKRWIEHEEKKGAA